MCSRSVPGVPESFWYPQLHRPEANDLFSNVDGASPTETKEHLMSPSPFNPLYLLLVTCFQLSLKFTNIRAQMCQPSHHWNKIPATQNLKEERFTLVHSCGEFSSCLPAPRQSHCGRKPWYENTAHHATAREQKEKAGAKGENVPF